MATDTRGPRYLGRYPAQKMAAGGSVGEPTKFFLPRAQIRSTFGDELRAEGLAGLPFSWGGSEIQFSDRMTPEQMSRVQALAERMPTPPAAAPPTLPISNADVARFLAQRGDLPGLPGLPGVGGDAGGEAGPAAGETTPGGNLDLSGLGRAADTVIGALNSPEGRTVTDTLQLGGLIPGVGPIPAAIGAIGRLVGNIGGRFGPFGGPPAPGTLVTSEPTIDPDTPTPGPTFTAHDLAVAGSLGISDPTTQGFASSRSPTGFFGITGQPVGPPSCFLAGTLVKTVDGYTAIEEIEPGVRVPTSKGISTIYRVFKGYEGDSYRINGIAVTGYHSFARPDGTWTAARDLKVGNEVCGFAGNLVIEQHEHVPTSAYVWNLLVEPAHEFYIKGLHGDYLVHNGDGVRRGDAPPRAYGWATIVNRGHEYLLDPRTHRSVELTGAKLARQKNSGLPLVKDPHGRRMRLDDGDGDGAGSGDAGSGESGGGTGDASGESGGGFGGEGTGPGESGAGFGPGEPSGNEPGITGEPTDPADAPTEPEGARTATDPSFSPSQVTTKMSQGGPVQGAAEGGGPFAGSWKGAKRFEQGGNVPVYHQRGSAVTPPESERQARARRVREFERRFHSMPV